jgi:hypothetical protein
MVDATGEVMKTLASAEAARAREMRDLLNIVFYFGERALFKRECRLLVESTVYAGSRFLNQTLGGKRITR